MPDRRLTDKALDFATRPQAMTAARPLRRDTRRRPVDDPAQRAAVTGTSP